VKLARQCKLLHHPEIVGRKCVFRVGHRALARIMTRFFRGHETVEQGEALLRCRLGRIRVLARASYPRCACLPETRADRHGYSRRSHERQNARVLAAFRQRGFVAGRNSLRTSSRNAMAGFGPVRPGAPLANPPRHTWDIARFDPISSPWAGSRRPDPRPPGVRHLRWLGTGAEESRAMHA